MGGRAARARVDQGYTYDLFISYKRGTEAEPAATHEWVVNHLWPQMQKWVPVHLDQRGVKIFLDENRLDPGGHWPMELRDALVRSKCMLAVFSTTYFASKWCTAELQSMFKRRALLAKKSPGQIPRIIYGITFADGETFPDYVAELKPESLYDWIVPEKAYQESPKYVEFVEKMKKVAAAVAAQIRSAPAWREWPVDLPKKLPRGREVDELPRMRR